MSFSSRDHLTAIFSARAEAPFLIRAEDGLTLTYAQARAAAGGLAAFLRAEGLGPGVPLAFSVDNCQELALWYLAAMLLGAPVLPVNPALSVADARQILEALGARHLVTTPQVLAGRREALGRLEGLKIYCFQPALKESRADWRELINVDFGAVSAPAAPAAGFTAADGDTLLLMPTSGTTGRPKVLDISWGGLFGNANLFASTMGLDEDCRFYNILPMTYLGGFYNLWALPMSCGASTVIDSLFGGAVMYGFWETVKMHGINVLWYTATMLSMLLEIDDGEDLSFLDENIKIGLVGMAPLAPSVKKRFQERFGFRLYENFALSETLFLTSQRPGRPESPGSSGPPLPGVTVEIRAEDGRPLPAGRAGEVYIQTPYRIKSYRLAGEADRAKLLPAGGMLTGDLGLLDEKGELSITGRLKDLIIRGGVNISPKMLEDQLLNCPLVAEAAVVGLPDQVYGEEVAAAVKLAPGAGPDAAQAVQAWARAAFPAFQSPKRFIFLDELPKGVTGKIQKSALIGMLSASERIA